MSEPHTKAEVLEALRALRTDGMRYWEHFAPRAFATPLADAWSPADNVRHLIKSTEPVTTALRLPRLVLKTSFGVADAPSASYGDLVTRYLEALANGGEAGKFAPTPEPPPIDPEAYQRGLIERCRNAVGTLGDVVDGWSDPDLDRYRLPHPLLGKLTLREMLLFTIYHFAHHRQNVVKRTTENLEGTAT